MGLDKGIIVKNALSRTSLAQQAIGGDAVRVRCSLAILQGLTNNTVDTTIDYGTNIYRNFRTIPINGYILPHVFEGNQIVNQTGTWQVATIDALICTIATTGAHQTILRRRYVMENPFTKGVYVGNFCFYTLGNENTDIGTHYVGANTGTTGTNTVTVNFGTMATDGTLTQISTASDQITLTAAAFRQAIYVSKDGVGAVGQDDLVYIEVIQDVNQTARTVGSTAVGSQFTVGQLNSSTAGSERQQTFLEFDVI